MKTKINSYHFLSLFLVPTIMLLACVSVQAQYVITYTSGTTTHFLANTDNDNTVDDVTTFDPNTCIWTTSLYQDNQYHYLNNEKYLSVSDGTVIFRSNDNNSCRIQTTDNYIFRASNWNGGNYYIRYNNGWTASNSNSNRAVRYTVSSQTQEAETTNYNPTISVAMNSENTGLQFSHGTFTQRIVPSYTYYTIGGTTYLNNTATTDYYLYNNTFYTSTDVFIPAEASEPDGTSYTWSVTSGGTYASITNDGLLTLNAGVVNSTQTVTVTLTIENSTYLSSPRTVTYNLTLQPVAASSTVTYSEMELSPSSATLDGENTTVTFTASNTLTKTTNNLQASTAFELEGTTYYFNGTAGSAFTTTQPVLSTTTESVGYTSFSWSFSGGSGNYYTPSTYYSENTNQLTLTRTSTLTAEDKTYTITLTGQYDGWSGSSQTATATLTIPKTRVNPTELHAQNYTIMAGETVAITYTYQPNYDAAGETYLNIQYSVTSGSQYASVSSEGVVTGLSVGQAVVTLQAINLDGTNGVSTSSTITVTDGNGTAEHPYTIGSAADLATVATRGLDKYYKVTADFDASSFTTTLTGFSGTLDGDYHTISGLRRAIFNTITGGTVKNVILDDVTITSGTNVGAIANEAEGATRIYNCGVLSGSISGTEDVGSIVGQISGTTNNVRVINCYSFATITGGSYVAGIVGRNESTATTTDNIGSSSMIMNCMFYGDITATGATNVSPIYGGNVISNAGGKGINNYNYYRVDASMPTITANAYNCALAAEERFLKRFEFYRYILNSNRELCAYYVSGSVNDTALIAKWVLDESIAEYPILKKWGQYPSIINPDYASASTESNAWEGKKLGTLSVTINPGDHGTGSTLSNQEFVITDIDSNNYDFNYYKIQLPYYNDYWNDNYTDYVVTGWKITSITGGTTGTFTTTGDDAYNFADRYCTNKDLYSVSGRVFAQGGYYNVPQGVTAITIEAYWGNAIYVSDAQYDVTYSTSYSATDFSPAGSRPTTYVDCNSASHTVYTITDAVASIISNVSTVYDQALVLVGNVHLYGGTGAPLYSSTRNYPFTVMSIDRDHDNEPDHTFFYQSTDRKQINPIRFDFLNYPGIGVAAKVTGTKRVPNQGIVHPNGWFEVTETCIVRYNEFEYDCLQKQGKNAPVIFNGGIIDQYVSTNQGNETESGINTAYHIIGGHAWFKAFTPGSHADHNYRTKHAPLNILGGELEEVYLTGMFIKDPKQVYTDNGQMYTNGGKVDHFAGGGLEKLNGNVIVKADHTIFHEFYGGGISSSNPVQGDINITIDHSIVGIFAGGPKFGAMEDDKIVTTNATGTIFNTYYGAGIGGTSINRIRTKNDWNQESYSFLTWRNDYVKGKYNSNYGIAIGYDYELFAWAGGSNDKKVGRFYVNYASLTKSTTHTVTSTLDSCIVKNNYYGAGHVGVSDGLVTSTLNNTEVWGDVYGGGNSSSAPTCEVYPLMTVQPTFDPNTGIYYLHKEDQPQPELYVWAYGQQNKLDSTTIPLTIYTTQTLSDMGQAQAGTVLTIDGGHMYGSVFGGGNQAKVIGNTNVTIKGPAVIGTFVNGVCTQGGNVYGGGNMGEVAGNTSVTIGECE